MRHAFVDHDNRLVLCWTPKCACTTLTFWFFYGRLGLTAKDLGGDPDVRAWLGRNGHMAHGLEIDPLLKKGYKSIALTRDPLDRAISAYVSKFVVGYKKRLVQIDDLEPFASDFYLKIRNGHNGAYTGISFEEFLTAIVEAVKERGAKEPDLNTHWNTQKPLRWEAKGIAPDQIFDVSQTLPMLEMLNEWTGSTWLPNQKMNPTDYSEASGYVGQVSSLDLANGETIPSMQQFISPRTIDLIREAYEVDYSLKPDYLQHAESSYPKATRLFRRAAGLVGYLTP